MRAPWSPPRPRAAEPGEEAAAAVEEQKAARASPRAGTPPPLTPLSPPPPSSLPSAPRPETPGWKAGEGREGSGMLGPRSWGTRLNTALFTKTRVRSPRSPRGYGLAGRQACGPQARAPSRARRPRLLCPLWPIHGQLRSVSFRITQSARSLLGRPVSSPAHSSSSTASSLPLPIVFGLWKRPTRLPQSRFRPQIPVPPERLLLLGPQPRVIPLWRPLAPVNDFREFPQPAFSRLSGPAGSLLLPRLHQATGRGGRPGSWKVGLRTELSLRDIFVL